MSAKTLNRLLVSTVARRLVRTFAFLFSLAALAAAANPDAVRKKAGADEGLRQAFERAIYSIEDSGHGIWRGVNPAQRLTLEFNGREARLTHPDGSVNFHLTGYGYGNRLRKPAPARLTGAGNRVEYQRGNLSEWYVNDSHGLEQGFTLAQRPGTDREGEPLVIALGVSGGLLPAQKANDDSVLFQSGNGVVLRYAGLKALDAHGRILRSRLEVRGEAIRLIVEDHGAQYPLTIDPTWVQQQELTASDGVFNDQFGYALAVSGDTAVIGAPGKNDNQGAAYVFVQNGGVWSQQQELTASDGAAGDFFGISVSVSGNTAVIGAYGHNLDQGAAYVFVQSGGVCSQQQKLIASDGVAGTYSPSVDMVLGGDWFGISVSVSGGTAVVGAVGKNGDQGAAYVFIQSGTAWSQQQELTASDGEANENFGNSVSVSGDTAVIGAPDENSLQGAAYVFVQSGTAWSQQKKLTASDGAANDFFGFSASLDGTTAVIGALGKSGNQGAAYVFVQSGATWNQQRELTASDGAANDNFGRSVSVSGNTAVIGAFWKTVDSLTYQGAAYVFVLSGGTWNQQQELTASDGAGESFFGCSVSVSGGTALIGAYVKSGQMGAAYVFAQPTITGVGVSGGGTNIAQNTWIEIYGSSLAPASVGAGGLTWSSAPSFASFQMPTELNGVSVTVNGNPAYVYFISPAQVNVLTPLDSTTGPVAVEVNNGGAASAAFTANLQAVSPGFLRFNDGIHIAARHADYSLLGPASLSVPGYTFTPAVPGEIILLYGDGFGLPVSTLTPGSAVQTGPLPTPWPQVTIGGTTATVRYAGLSSPGLYQINVVVPANAANGDNQVIATYAGASSPTGAMIPVSQ